MMPRRVVAVLGLVAMVASGLVTTRVLVVAGAPVPGADEVVAHVDWVEAAVAGGADADMQALFPEGRLFMHVLTGMAQAALLADPETRELTSATVADVRAHLTTVDAEGAHFGSGMVPEHGIFHAGWALSLAVDLAAITGDDRDLRDVDARADIVAAALSGPDGPFPPSYPGRHWPVDAVVAASGLARAGALLDRDDTPVLDGWRERALALADPDLGLLPHEVSGDGAALDGPRGSSQAMVQAFWPDVTEALGQVVDHRTWTTFKQSFVVRRLGVVAVREYPVGVDGRGDVDSGPLLAGLSASASAVTLAAARRVGDTSLATTLDREAELFGVPWEWDRRRRMLLGALPVADAFVVWARTRPEAGMLTTSVPVHPSPRWWQLLALALAPGMVGAVAWWWARTHRHRPA